MIINNVRESRKNIYAPNPTGVKTMRTGGSHQSKGFNSYENTPNDIDAVYGFLGSLK